jgi:nucleotide-binding universal stress UspA family protein
VHGAPVPVLTAAADGAPIVVGHRGRDGFAGLRLGATGLQLATHASGPVVVVRGTGDTVAGPVLVGADGSPGADPAIAQAFQAAAGRGHGVLAVRAYQIPAPHRDDSIDPLAFNLDRLQAVEHAALRDAIAPWRGRYPEIPVETALRLGEAADVLTAMSAEAPLVVVGTRGHGGFTGLLLGSVGQKLLHHAHCPVMIAR